MEITESKLRQIIRKTLREGSYEKLNSRVTGDSSNLDQEVYFGLEQDVEDLCNKYADNIRYAQHGVNAKDVFETLKKVISQIDPKIMFL